MPTNFQKKLPNAITIFRTILSPFVLWAIWISHSQYFSLKDDFSSTQNIVTYASYFVYCFATVFFFTFVALLDRLDGVLARKFNAITDFGKMLDPIADKLLICGSLIVLCFFYQNLPFISLVIIIILREIIVTCFRFFVVRKSSIVIPADKFGKLKTVFQSVAIGFFISPLEILPIWFYAISYILLIISTVLAIISAINYFSASKK